jgi:hypothetical protein
MLTYQIGTTTYRDLSNATNEETGCPTPGSVRAYQRRLARFEIGDYDAQRPRHLPEREPAFV